MIAIIPLILNCVQYTTDGKYYEVKSKDRKHTCFIGNEKKEFKVGNEMLHIYFGMEEKVNVLS